MLYARKSASSVALLLVLLCAAASRAEPKHITTVEGISEYRLDNGLKLLLFPDASRATVTVNLTILVGSRHEGYGEGGMAHLLEHMMFKGTPAFPDFRKVMTERGARWNGSTWFDRTNYFETVPASDDNLEFCVKFEADRLVNCPIKAEDLASEMSVVRNEFDMGENNPGSVLYKRMLGIAYEWHNYGKSTIGNRTDIERVPADRLRRFYQKFYQPDNSVVIIAGRFEEKKAIALAEKYFGAIPRPQRVIETTYTEEPAQDGERTVTLRRVGDVGIVAMAYHVPAGAHEELPAVQALAEILTSAPEGILYKALVETKKATGVGGSALALHDPGVLYVAAMVRTDQSIEDVRRSILETIDKVIAAGVTDEQVQRYKTQFKADRNRTMADTTRLGVDLSNWASMGDWRLFFLLRDRTEKLTAKDVNAVAKKYLASSNRTTGVYIPTKQPERTNIPATPDVSSLLKDYKGREAVAAGEQLDPDPMKLEARIKRSDLPTGIKVALLPKKTRQEMVNLRLTLRYGNAENLKGKGEAADMLPGLMMRGTQKLSRQQLKDALDKNEATLNLGGGAGGLTVSLQAPQKNLMPTLDLLRQVLREPSFPEDEFEIMRRQSLASIENNRSEPRYLASQALARKLFDYPRDDVRYVPTIDEALEDLRGLKLEQIRDLYAKFLGAEHGELAIVGQFDPDPVITQVNSMLRGWKSEMPYARIDRKAKNGITGSFEVVAVPDKPNAVYVGALMIPMTDDHPDAPALEMAGRILGGSASARLWERIRQKEGISYSVGAGFSASPFDPSASMRVQAIFSSADFARLKQAMAEEVKRFVEKGVNADELAREREALLKQEMMSRTQDSSLTSIIASGLHAGRTLKYDAEMEQKIKDLTPDQIGAAIRKYLDPDKFVTVVSGDLKK